ncbi:SulP family inorganic anion transporter [Streptomyces sp. NBC_01205]|uniref:SulP family inorganic anion transporter n=1 Tax=Streptomyces sp. NBC_01205 TaxID=2903771 RepID=UPI002E163FE6|nr:SulP family inorganic anion transporter [Streptomyces sp. NBC_01205]
MVVGLLCPVAWGMRLGFLADLLSRPVLVGYVAGVAMIMIVDQLPRLTGVRASGSGFFPQLLSAVRHASEAHWPTVVLAAAVLVVLFAAPFLWRTPWPAARPRRRHGCGGRLRARRPVRDYGDRPGSGGPASPELPSIADLSHLLPPALGILLIGYSDVILTARAFAAHDDPRPLDANRELLALGAANLGAGVLHGFPVSSRASRTARADSTGAGSQGYPRAATLAVLTVLLFLVPSSPTPRPPCWAPSWSMPPSASCKCESSAASPPSGGANCSWRSAAHWAY